MKKIFITLILLIIPFINLFSDDEYEAYILANEGIKQINEKKYSEAIETFNKAINLNYGNIEFHYEKALAFTLNKQGDSAIAVLEDLIRWDEASDQIYQLLATNYTASKKSEDAAKYLTDEPLIGTTIYIKASRGIGLEKVLPALQT